MKNFSRCPLSFCLGLFILGIGLSPCYSQTTVNAEIQDPLVDPVPAVKVIPSEEFVKQGWAASGEGDEAKLDRIVTACLAAYDQEARQQQAALTSFPPRGQEKDYQSLNDVGTMLFIKAEFLMNHGKSEEATALFNTIRKE